MTDNKLCRFCGKDAKAERSTKEFCSVVCHDSWWAENRRLGSRMIEAFPCLCEECKAKVTQKVSSQEIKKPVDT